MIKTRKTKFTALLLGLITLFSALFIPINAAEPDTLEDVGIEEIMPMASYYCPVNADLFFADPTLFARYSPEYLYYALDITYEVKPLGDGAHKGKDYLDGGGFRINWGGDRMLSYHPAGSLYHNNGEPYYKLSSGTYGVRHFDLNGNPCN